MSEESTKYLDPQQVVFLPKWARYTILSLLGILAFAACISAVVFLFFPEYRARHCRPLFQCRRFQSGNPAI